MNGGPGTNWGARIAEQFPHLGNYTSTPDHDLASSYHTAAEVGNI